MMDATARHLVNGSGCGSTAERGSAGVVDSSVRRERAGNLATPIR